MYRKVFKAMSKRYCMEGNSSQQRVVDMGGPRFDVESRPFVRMINLPENSPPIRAYVHRAGLVTAYQKNRI